MAIAIAHIGSGPYEESLAVLGDRPFSKRNLIETLTYAKQLKRKFGDPPPGTELGVGSEILDSAGVLWSVRVTYEQDDPEAVAYLGRVSEGMPRWDQASKEELASIGL